MLNKFLMVFYIFQGVTCIIASYVELFSYAHNTGLSVALVSCGILFGKVAIEEFQKIRKK
jgi:pyruvate-formate lyase-activating enzyme